jgi:hypothetical protein
MCRETKKRNGYLPHNLLIGIELFRFTPKTGSARGLLFGEAAVHRSCYTPLPLGGDARATNPASPRRGTNWGRHRRAAPLAPCVQKVAQRSGRHCKLFMDIGLWLWTPAPLFFEISRSGVKCHCETMKRVPPLQCLKMADNGRLISPCRPAPA